MSEYRTGYSYKVYCVQGGFGGDGSRSPHSRGAGEDTGGSPSLNGLGLTAFANHGLLDQALRGLTPPSPVCPQTHQGLSFCLLPGLPENTSVGRRRPIFLMF